MDSSAFAYSPICTWDSFPPIIYTERERILPVLKEWEHKGYLTLIYDEKIGRFQHANALTIAKLKNIFIKAFKRRTKIQFFSRTTIYFVCDLGYVLMTYIIKNR